MTNKQPILKKDKKQDPDALRVHSMFKTIQGEGPFSGRVAVFIRLSGCNLQCPLCDTEYADGSTYTVQELANLVSRQRTATGRIPLVVLTGGEPFRQPIGKLVEYLLVQGYTVQIETNGTLYDADIPYGHKRLVIVCSPKAAKVNTRLLPHIAAFKYVATCQSLVNSDDGLPATALDHPVRGRIFRKPADHPAEVYLQPVDTQDSQNELHLDAVVNSCLEYGHRLCLQTHKIVNVP